MLPVAGLALLVRVNKGVLGGKTLSEVAPTRLPLVPVTVRVPARGVEFEVRVVVTVPLALVVPLVGPEKVARAGLLSVSLLRPNPLI